MKSIKIYTTSHCPYCVAAKTLFKNLNLQFEEISLNGQDDLRQQLSEENQGWRTVPMIFIGDQFVGGFTDVQQLHDQGRLVSALS